MSYVKPLAYTGGAYILYEIGRAMWWELKINSYNNRVLNTGGVVSDEDQFEKQEIK